MAESGTIQTGRPTPEQLNDRADEWDSEADVHTETADKARLDATRKKEAADVARAQANERRGELEHAEAEHVRLETQAEKDLKAFGLAKDKIRADEAANKNMKESSDRRTATELRWDKSQGAVNENTELIKELRHRTRLTESETIERDSVVDDLVSRAEREEEAAAVCRAKAAELRALVTVYDARLALLAQLLDSVDEVAPSEPGSLVGLGVDEQDPAVPEDAPVGFGDNDSVNPLFPDAVAGSVHVPCGGTGETARAPDIWEAELVCSGCPTTPALCGASACNMHELCVEDPQDWHCQDLLRQFSETTEIQWDHDTQSAAVQRQQHAQTGFDATDIANNTVGVSASAIGLAAVDLGILTSPGAGLVLGGVGGVIGFVGAGVSANNLRKARNRRRELETLETGLPQNRAAVEASERTLQQLKQQHNLVVTDLGVIRDYADDQAILNVAHSGFNCVLGTAAGAAGGVSAVTAGVTMWGTAAAANAWNPVGWFLIAFGTLVAIVGLGVIGWKVIRKYMVKRGRKRANAEEHRDKLLACYAHNPRPIEAERAIRRLFDNDDPKYQAWVNGERSRLKPAWYKKNQGTDEQLKVRLMQWEESERERMAKTIQLLFWAENQDMDGENYVCNRETYSYKLVEAIGVKDADKLRGKSVKKARERIAKGLSSW